jgi:hypothetical protein
MLTKKQAQLCELMHQISQDCYCAGWMSQNEFRLWSAVVDPTDDLEYGFAAISPDEVMQLRQLSEEIGGWIVWDGEIGDLVFLSLEAWQKRYAATPPAIK